MIVISEVALERTIVFHHLRCSKVPSPVCVEYLAAVPHQLSCGAKSLNKSDYVRDEHTRRWSENAQNRAIVTTRSISGGGIHCQRKANNANKCTNITAKMDIVCTGNQAKDNARALI